MSKRRNTYKYHFKIGNKIVHSGITKDLKRREQEHQGKWPKGLNLPHFLGQLEKLC
jgi:predicted GIY-YIG superfamily endonuclease